MRHLEMEYGGLGAGGVSDGSAEEKHSDVDSYGNGWGILDSFALAAMMSVIIMLLGAAIFMPMSMVGLAVADPSLWSW